MQTLNDEMDKFGNGIFYIINSPDEEQKESNSSEKVIWVYSLNNDDGGWDFHECVQELVDQI